MSKNEITKEAVQAAISRLDSKYGETIYKKYGKDLDYIIKIKESNHIYSKIKEDVLDRLKPIIRPRKKESKKGETSIDISVIEKLFFDKNILEILMSLLSSADWRRIITRLLSLEEMDKRIIRLLFFDEDVFARLIVIIKKSDWKIIYRELNMDNDMDKSIANLISKNVLNPDRKFKALIAALNEIYYSNPKASLHSKRLYMIKIATTITGDIESAMRYIDENYQFNIRKVDSKKIKKRVIIR